MKNWRMGSTGRMVVYTIITTLLQEAAVVAFILWILPEAGLRMSPSGIAIILVVQTALAVFMFRLGLRAMTSKAMAGMDNMVGTTGIIVTPTFPNGTVKIASELWAARSNDSQINKGEKVIVIKQEGLKLVVRRLNHG